MAYFLSIDDELSTLPVCGYDSVDIYPMSGYDADAMTEQYIGTYICMGILNGKEIVARLCTIDGKEQVICKSGEFVEIDFNLSFAMNYKLKPGQRAAFIMFEKPNGTRLTCEEAGVNIMPKRG